MKKPLDAAPEAKRTVAHLFDAVRGEVSADAYTVVPALLLCGRLVAFQELLVDWSTSTDSIARYAEFFEKPTNVPDVLATREYVRAISQFSRSTQQALLAGLHQLDLPTLPQANFEAVFDYALDWCISTARRDAGEWKMPAELVELVASIADAQAGERIFNLYAHTAPLVSWLEPMVEYTGVEENVRIRGLAMLRLIAHNRSAASMANPTSGQWPDAVCDVVCAVAPIIPQRLGFNAAPRPNAAAVQVPADVAAITQALYSLKEGGRAIMAVSQSFLFRSDSTTARFRQKMLNQGWLESIIEFPSGLLSPYASLSFSLLILRVNNSHPGEVLLIDAEPFVTPGRDRRQVLHVAGVLDALHRSEGSAHARHVAHAELAENNYNLVARRYLTPVVTHPDDVELGQFAQLIRRERPALPHTGRFVGIRNLLKDNADYLSNWYALDWAELPLVTSEKPAFPIADDALLLATQFGALKPTWFTYDPAAALFISTGIVALQLDLSRVDVEYLVTELNSDYIRHQLKALQVGSVVTTLSRQDLLRLRVRLPKELRQQRAVVDGIREQFIKKKQQEVDALRASRMQKAESFQQFTALKHALGQPQLKLASGVAVLESVIRRYAADNRVLSLTSRLNDTKTRTVQDTIDSLKQAVQFIFTTLDRNDHELVLDNFPKKLVEIIDYLRRRVIQTNALGLGFVASFAADEDDFFNYTAGDERGDESVEWDTAIYVQANEYLLDRLFDHILINARRHGFLNASKPSNRLVFEVSADLDVERQVSGSLRIRIRNNGAPFPLNFDPAGLFRKNEFAGETGNTGIGGYEVKEIVGYFDGTVHAAPSAYRDFPVEYNITLPIAAAESRTPAAEEDPDPDA